MKVYRKGLDKWDLTPIIRQTDKVSLSVFPALNFILPYKRTCCVHRFSVGVGWEARGKRGRSEEGKPASQSEAVTRSEIK